MCLVNLSAVTVRLWNWQVSQVSSVTLLACRKECLVSYQSWYFRLWVLVLGLEVMGIGFGVLLLLFDDCTCSYQTQRNLSHREIETLYSIHATTTSSTTAFSFCLTGIFSDYFRSDGLPKKLCELLVNLFHRLYASPPPPPVIQPAVS